jgi:hypothetical protein
MERLPTWDDLNLLVDTDPIKLRDVAWELVKRLETNERIRQMIHNASNNKGEH